MLRDTIENGTDSDFLWFDETIKSVGSRVAAPFQVAQVARCSKGTMIMYSRKMKQVWKNLPQCTQSTNIRITPTLNTVATHTAIVTMAESSTCGMAHNLLWEPSKYCFVFFSQITDIAGKWDVGSLDAPCHDEVCDEHDPCNHTQAKPASRILAACSPTKQGSRIALCPFHTAQHTNTHTHTRMDGWMHTWQNSTTPPLEKAQKVVK